MRASEVVICAIHAGWSDWLDGYLARLLDQQSVLGSYLDPLADKVLISCVVGSLGYQVSWQLLDMWRLCGAGSHCCLISFLYMTQSYIVLAQGTLPVALVALILGRDALLVAGCFAMRARELGWHWPGMLTFFRIGSADAQVQILGCYCVQSIIA